MSSLESLCEDIRTNVTVWKRYRDKGGSDPSWSDGDNMNLCRNHIIDDRRRIEEIIARDGIEPPADLFSRLDNEFHFTLDAASSESNHKCSKYYTAGNSAFNHEWGGETVFCNPPYGKAISEWVRKCSMEASRKDTLVVMLLPARTDTRWFQQFILDRAEVRFLKG